MIKSETLKCGKHGNWRHPGRSSKNNKESKTMTFCKISFFHQKVTVAENEKSTGSTYNCNDIFTIMIRFSVSFLFFFSAFKHNKPGPAQVGAISKAQK